MHTNWNARYQYITGSLSTAIASPLPPDFRWTPVGELHANAGVGSCAPHRIVHATPAPEQVAELQHLCRQLFDLFATGGQAHAPNGEDGDGEDGANGTAANPTAA
jgi:hypothetical protein